MPKTITVVIPDAVLSLLSALTDEQLRQAVIANANDMLKSQIMQKIVEEGRSGLSALPSVEASIE